MVIYYTSTLNIWRRIPVEFIPQTFFGFEQGLQDWKPNILSFAICSNSMFVHDRPRLHRDEYLNKVARLKLKTIHDYVAIVLQNNTYLIGVYESQLCIFDQWFNGKPLVEGDYISSNDVNGRFYDMRMLSIAPVHINTYSCWKIVGHEDTIFFFLCNGRDIEVLLYSPSKDIWER